MSELPTQSIPSTPTNCKKTLAGIFLLGVLITICGFSLKILAASSSKTFRFTSSTTSTASALTVPTTTFVAHIPLPNEVRGFYWTGYTAGSKRVDELLKYAVNSHLNTVVIDLKLDDGTLSFAPKSSDLKPYQPKYPAIRNLDELLGKLGEKQIYRIARIAIMRDGSFGKINPSVALHNLNGGYWQDKTGAFWLDPAAPAVAKYAVALAREAYERGFDEMQFDYVRFPSDGFTKAIKYPVYDSKTSRISVMRTFFENTGGVLRKEKIPVSFDLFGMSFWTVDDFGVGQRLADVYEFADAVSPMVYPSHYPNGFLKFANPADHPYEIVKQSLDMGLEILKAEASSTDMTQVRKHFRPWLQDFNLGATYDAAKVQSQIKAARDAGASGWMLWNASNKYTPTEYLQK